MLKILAPKKRSLGFLSSANQNNTIIFISICYLIGILVGVLLFKNKSASDNNYYKEFSQLYSQLTLGFMENFGYSLLRELPFIAGIFLAGSCMVGGIIVPAIILLRGALYGIIMGYTCFNYGLTGIVFNLLILIPPAVIWALALILSARESFGFSICLARLVLPESNSGRLDKDFKIYCLRQLFVLLFFLLGAFIQTLMAVSFIDFFKL